METLQGSKSEAVVETGRKPTWVMADGRKNVKAPWVGRGYQDPDLRRGDADTTGCVSLRSSYFRAIPLGAPKGWKIWRLDIENVFLFRDSAEWDESNPHRVWKMNARA